jgi:hypothetical protein
MMPTAAQLAVMRAMDKVMPPYTDDVQRHSGLARRDFEEAVERLVAAGVVREYTAPLGSLLYLTLRGADDFVVVVGA